MKEKEFTHEESIRLINEMIGKAKNNVHDNGISAIMWGVVISFCSLFSYFQLTTGLFSSIDIWLLTFLAVIPQIYFSIKKTKKTKVVSYDENALNWVWGVFGIGVFMIVFINSKIYSAMQPLLDEYTSLSGKKASFRFSEFSVGYFLLWYGFPGVITGGIKKFYPMLAGGLLCWVFSIVILFTPKQIDLLLMAVSAVFAWLVPGILLRKRFLKEYNPHV